MSGGIAASICAEPCLVTGVVAIAIFAAAAEAHQSDLQPDSEPSDFSIRGNIRPGMEPDGDEPTTLIPILS